MALFLHMTTGFLENWIMFVSHEISSISFRQYFCFFCCRFCCTDLSVNLSKIYAVILILKVNKFIELTC